MSKTKKRIIAIGASVLAVITVITSCIIGFGNGNKKNKKPKAKDTTSISMVALDELGTELEIPEQPKKEYGKTTGNVDVNKIVEKNNKVYVDKASADKTDKVGTSSIDTQGGKLKVEDGKVKEKDESYEVKDDNKVVDSGEGKIPDGYAWDSVINKYLPKEEVGKYVYSDATYYDENGKTIINKGDVVSVETLQNAKEYLTTTKPANTSSSTSSTTSSSTSSTTSSTSDKGIVNKDGTYTIFGLTFESKADYEQWVIQGYEGYVEADGIMISEEELNNRLGKTK